LGYASLYALNPKPKGVLLGVDKADALLGLGRAHIGLKQYKAAIKPLEEAVEARGDMAEAYRQLALAYEGLEHWTRVLSLSAWGKYLVHTLKTDEVPDEVKSHLWALAGIRWTAIGGPITVFDKWLYQIREDGTLVGRMLDSGKIQWRFRDVSKGPPLELSQLLLAGLAADGNGVYITTTREPAVVSLNPKTGELKWRTQIEGGNPKIATVVDGTLYILSFTPREQKEESLSFTLMTILSALSTETGELLWKFTDEQRDRPPYPPPGLMPPRLLVSDYIYWRTEGGALYTLAKDTGELAWKFETGATSPKVGSPFLSPPPPAVLHAEMLYVAIENALVALDPNTGAVRWKKDVPGLQPDAYLVDVGGLVYLDAVEEKPQVERSEISKTGKDDFIQHHLYALRADSGEVQWQFDTKVPSFRSEPVIPVITPEALFVTLEDTLYALDPRTGDIQWMLLEVGSVHAVTDDTVYSVEYSVQAVDRKTGVLKWEYPGPSNVEVTDDFLIATTTGIPAGVLYVLDLAQIDQLLAGGKVWWTSSWQEYYSYERAAERFHEKGMLQQAIAAYKEAIKRAPEPQVFWLYAELAEVYSEQGNLEAAEKAYAKTGLPQETDWLVIGPFDNADNQGLTIVYPPETKINLSTTYQGKNRAVKWQKADDGQMDERLDFTKMFTPSEWVLAYALIDVISPDDREAQLRIGSDDGVKVWLNGQVVWTNQAPRGLRLDEDVVPIALKQGNNRLLFKVDQGIGGWGLVVRITDTARQPLEGLCFRSPKMRSE